MFSNYVIFTIYFEKNFMSSNYTDKLSTYLYYKHKLLHCSFEDNFSLIGDGSKMTISDAYYKSSIISYLSCTTKPRLQIKQPPKHYL